jgi:outer membrane protein assembly factor BamA
MEVPDEVSCRLEAMNNKRARHTIVFTEQEGDSRRINRIEIKGEDVAHVF